MTMVTVISAVLKSVSADWKLDLQLTCALIAKPWMKLRKSKSLAAKQVTKLSAE